MNVDFKIAPLIQNADWKGLAQVLGGPSPVVNNVIRHLIATNVTSYLLETRYIDRDYSSDYRRFYSQTFKTYDRHCQRVHFFAEDIAAITDKPTWAERVQALQNTSRRSYRGFCVIRPLPGAPIGRTVLYAAGPAGADLESVVTCRAFVPANLLGAELEVVSASFMQQDSRVGACAQVAIWAGARHMHQRYKYDWLSVADITRLAAPTTAEEATSLPAGSDFLTSERMIRAINEMGFQPLCFEGPNIGTAILPYVESGLPVILGLQEGNRLGHAVTVIGRVFSKLKRPANEAINYVSAFIVHDDQAGPYMLVPAEASSIKNYGLDPKQVVSHEIRGKNTEFNVKDHGVFAVALMPIRAFSTAQEAERTALRRIESAFANMDKVRLGLARRNAKPNDRLLNELMAAHKANKLLLRTYLTSASGYRRHIALGTACDNLKDVLLRLHLPHFTWITEISTADSYNESSAGLRRMYGHSVLDATSTGKDVSGLLVLHLPGMLFLRNVDAHPGQPAQSVTVIENDALYECREKRFDH
jgi:hypothetical protein